MLEIKVEKKLGDFQLNVDLQIPSQNITAIFGVSGSGKSTLINLIAGLIKPDQGKIILNDKILADTSKNIWLAPNQRNMGYVFQDGRLFPHYSVKGNLAYGMKQKSAVKIQEISELLGIEHLLKRYPISLSGGEKQRVAIGRALLSEPEMLLMDEPLSALDQARKLELLDYLENLSQQVKIPILYVTHSIEELQRLADQVILLEQGQVMTYGELDKVIPAQKFS